MLRRCRDFQISPPTEELLGAFLSPGHPRHTNTCTNTVHPAPLRACPDLAFCCGSAPSCAPLCWTPLRASSPECAKDRFKVTLLCRDKKTHTRPMSNAAVPGAGAVVCSDHRATHPRKPLGGQCREGPCRSVSLRLRHITGVTHLEPTAAPERTGSQDV